MTDLADLIHDPAWFPTGFSNDYRHVNFARLDRKSLSEEAFLDQRLTATIAGGEAVAVPELLAAAVDYDQPPPAFIFHSAFCCSTLLARALDSAGTALAYKEPDLLMGLANALRVDKSLAQSPQQVDKLSRLIIALLGRRFESAEAIVIKPTNAANNLLPLIVAARAPVLLLNGDLRSFLVSVLKKGEACKAFVRQQYNIFALDGYGLGSIPQRQAVAFTDLQAAAIVWRHQLELFARTVQENDTAKVATLDFSQLLAAPQPTVAAVARHLHLGHSDELVATIASGPVFRQNAKFTEQAFDSGQRELEADTLEERYGDTLDLIEHWAAQLDLGTALSLPIGNRLLA